MHLWRRAHSHGTWLRYFKKGFAHAYSPRKAPSGARTPRLPMSALDQKRSFPPGQPNVHFAPRSGHCLGVVSSRPSQGCNARCGIFLIPRRSGHPPLYPSLAGEDHPKRCGACTPLAHRGVDPVTVAADDRRWHRHLAGWPGNAGGETTSLLVSGECRWRLSRGGQRQSHQNDSNTLFDHDNCLPWARPCHWR